MNDHRSPTRALPPRTSAGSEIARHDSQAVDLADLHRARHLLGIAAGVLLAWYPVFLVFAMFDPATKGGGGWGWLPIVMSVFIPWRELADLFDGSFLGLQLCGLCVVFALPFLAVALAVFTTGWVLTVEAIHTRYRRLGIDAYEGDTMTAQRDNRDGEPVGMPAVNVNKRWIIALVLTLVAAIGGWRWYMEQGAHVNAGLIKLDASQEFPEPNENALVRAIGRGDVGTIESLVRQGVNVNAVSAYRRVSPLIWAVLARNQDSARTLLALGADPNFRVPTAPGMEPRPRPDEETNDMVGESPISEAIRRNDYAILKLLLERGGNPNIEGQGPPAVFEMSQLPEKRVNPMLQLMIDHGLDVNIGGARDSLLKYMITTGQFETAIHLIERGANVNLLDEKVSVPCSRYPRKTELDDDELVVNYGAWQLQRITGPDGTRGDEVSHRLRKMFEERGVKMPFWDPDSIRRLEVPSLKELREKGTPDEVIKKIIRINKAAEIEEFGPDLESAIAKRYTYGHTLERQYAEERKRRN